MRELIVQRNGQVRQAGATNADGDTVHRLKDAAERSLYVFAKSILDWDKLTPGLHGDICRRVQRRQPRRQGYLLPRGHFKTTLSKSLVIHISIQSAEGNIYIPNIAGRELRQCYMCKTTDRAETRIRAIQETYEQKELLKAFWPETVWEDPTIVKTKWNQQRLLLKRERVYDECTIERTGTNAAITGGHFDIFHKDDLIDIKDANEPTTMATSIAWNDASDSLANDPETLREWYWGTRWAAFDLYTDVMLKDPYDEADGEGVDWYVRAAIENGQPIFPERFTLAKLNRLRRKNENLFFLNYMNTTVGSKMQDFTDLDIREFTCNGDEIYFDDLQADADLIKLVEGEGSGDSCEENGPASDLYRRLRSANIVTFR